MLGRVALVKIDISEECIASITSVTRIGEIGTTLPITNNRRTLQIIPVTLFMEVIRSLNRRFLQESHGITSQKTALFISAFDSVKGKFYPKMLLFATLSSGLY
jgi:hypothetical protein